MMCKLSHCVIVLLSLEELLFLESYQVWKFQHEHTCLLFILYPSSYTHSNSRSLYHSLFPSPCIYVVYLHVYLSV